jgi:hypothetical protein
LQGKVYIVVLTHKSSTRKYLEKNGEGIESRTSGSVCSIQQGESTQHRAEEVICPAVLFIINLETNIKKEPQVTWKVIAISHGI